MVFNKIYSTKLDKQKLFEAWVSPRIIIDPVFKVEVNLTVGGNLKLYSKFNNDVVIMNGEFIKIKINKLLKYTWNWSNSSEITIVNVSFTTKNKITMVEIAHGDFERSIDVKNYEAGWDHYFSELVKRIS